MTFSEVFRRDHATVQTTQLRPLPDTELSHQVILIHPSSKHSTLVLCWVVRLTDRLSQQSLVRSDHHRILSCGSPASAISVILWLVSLVPLYWLFHLTSWIVLHRHRSCGPRISWREVVCEISTRETWTSPSSNYSVIRNKLLVLSHSKYATFILQLYSRMGAKNYVRWGPKPKRK